MSGTDDGWMGCVFRGGCWVGLCCSCCVMLEGRGEDETAMVIQMTWKKVKWEELDFKIGDKTVIDACTIHSSHRPNFIGRKFIG